MFPEIAQNKTDKAKMLNQNVAFWQRGDFAKKQKY